MQAPFSRASISCPSLPPLLRTRSVTEDRATKVGIVIIDFRTRKGITVKLRISKIAARRAAAVVLAAGLGLTATGTAYADPGAPQPGPVQILGSNGQQVRVCDDSALWQAVKLSGTSHSGTSASTSSRLDVDGCHSFNNWWWVGQVTLKWFRDGSSTTKTTYCHVPKVDPDWNWVVCFSN